MEVSEATIPLNWTKTSPSVYERAIADFEKFFLFIAVVGQGRPDRQNWNTATGIRIETKRDDFVGDVKEAWRALRYDHPCFAAIIEGDRWLYHVADEQELSVWMEETFHVHNVHQTARELFPFETNPSRRTVLHVLPRTQELVLQGPHTHVDGIGMTTFFDNLLRFLVAPSRKEPTWGDEGKNLTPPLTITAKIPECTAEQKHAWDANLSHYLAQFPTVRVHNENAGDPAKTTKLRWLRFTRAETTSIAAQSKSLGFSVTAAAQSAISHAARIHGHLVDAISTHSTFAIYDARAFIDPREYPSRTLVGPHIFSMPAVFPIIGGANGFCETAKRAGEIFVDFKTRDDDLMRATSPFWATEIPAALSTPMPEGTPVAADLQLSSVGILDRHLKTTYSHPHDTADGGGENRAARSPIDVHGIWVALDMLSPNIAVEMWTFRGELCIELIYNEAFHREESVDLLCRLLHEQLQQGLGVNVGLDVRAPGPREEGGKGVLGIGEPVTMEGLGKGGLVTTVAQVVGDVEVV